jgi:hypothetical protein
MCIYSVYCCFLKHLIQLIRNQVDSALFTNRLGVRYRMMLELPYLSDFSDIFVVVKYNGNVFMPDLSAV